MAGTFQHYRLSILGQDLKETLDELVANDMFEDDYRDMVWEYFDKAISNELANIKTKATIRGDIKHYRNHDDIWTIVLKSIDYKVDGKSVSSDSKTEMIAVTKR